MPAPTERIPAFAGRGALAFVVALIAVAALAAEPLHAPLPLRHPVQDKNFFVLSAMESSAAIANDAELKRLLTAKRDALHKLAACADVECFAAPMRWSDAEINDVAAALRRLSVPEMTERLRRSGAYVRYEDDLLASAWRHAAKGINNIIDVYGTGKAPRYPAIDAVSFDVKSEGYVHLLATAAGSLDEQEFQLFFQPPLRFALDLLEVNHRDEAGRHEPMESKDNAAAFRRIGAIQWKKYPYSAIVLPGAGSDRTTWRLSPASRLRAELAARRYKQGKAPLIIVSGGYVHPSQTPYSEAIEMKKVLVADFGVPAAAIIVDPHARHTTTNLRNAARLMYRYGVPFGAKALITTDRFQSQYIEGEAFAKRCDQELGYQPIKVLGRVSPFDLEFTPRLDSLQIDPMDPLDP
jgi:hypothetical protein